MFSGNINKIFDFIQKFCRTSFYVKNTNVTVMTYIYIYIWEMTVKFHILFYILIFIFDIALYFSVKILLIKIFFYLRFWS